MDTDHYEYSANESLQVFEFESNGPNGIIRKVIKYTLHNIDGTTYFNLAFGDVNSETNQLNDKVVSDNKDTLKILATVAKSVLELTERYPDMMVYAEGSTLARTRLYQIGIARYWNEIQLLLDIYGLLDGNWHPFSKNINFQAFLAFRKKS